MSMYNILIPLIPSTVRYGNKQLQNTSKGAQVIQLVRLPLEAMEYMTT